MKIAVTADLHLTSRYEHPERYHALENILDQMIRDQIDTLIIAGDLFDESSRNYAEFDNFCKEPKYKGLNFYLIPGNHDSRISNAFITAESVEIITEPKIIAFNSTGLKFLLLPYRKDKTMGEDIASIASELPPNEWVLIGHGDWSEGMRESNPFEPGVYMPLTRIDIEKYKPANIVLGHIHKPLDRDRVHYVGSPCGLDITETGRRRFLIIDTNTGFIKSQIVESDFIFYNESLIILPLKDEKDYLKEQIEAKIKAWALRESEKPKVRIRVKVSGYTANKRELLKTINESFHEFTYYKNGEPDISEVYVSDDVERAEIAHRVSTWIDKLELLPELEHPAKDQILLQALHVIYGEG